MRRGGGKQKGASFEREVCVLLSKWVSSDAQEDVFWRSAMSGGRATVAFKKGKSLATQVGDISCISPIGQKLVDNFALECKFYRDLDYQGLLTGKGKLLQFWAEIETQALRFNKQPFLIARQNRTPAHICLSKTGMRFLGLRDKDTLLISVRNDLYLFEADRFVKICPPFIH